MIETLIVGLGSSHGDDQFGWRVAEQLIQRQNSPNVTVRLARSPADMLGWFDGMERLIVCDACQDLGSPGAIQHWQWPDPMVSVLRFAGSHDLGIAAALELADSLGEAPADVSIWCAEGLSFGAGEPLSAPLETAVADMVALIQIELLRRRNAEFPYWV